MATVSGVWVFNDYVYIDNMGNVDEAVNFTSNGDSFMNMYYSHYYDGDSDENVWLLTYNHTTSSSGGGVYVWGGDDGGNSLAWVNENYKTVDFGNTQQTVSDEFYSFLTDNATKQAEPAPTPDWANCFVKTSAGNKAVEKVWIKQNGQLVTVYDGGGGGAAVNFATDSWETISAACKDGSYKTVYHVGDTKDITLSTVETITVAIMGFDHDDLSDGSGKAPITVAMENLLATNYRMNASNTNEGGWDECEMRTSTMATLLSQLPSELQSAIKQVNKKATAGSKSTAITTSADKLWLFAEVEVDGTTSTGYADEGEQYEYWKTVKDGKKSADRRKYLSNGGGSAYSWWLRSPYVSNSYAFRYIFSSGTVSYATAGSTCYVPFGFCIG